MAEYDAVAQIDERLDSLRAKLKARTGKSAYLDNVPKIEAEIARLEGTRAMIVDARKAK